METMAAYAMGAVNRGKDLMVFDWDKAAERIAVARPLEANAGLSGDWEFTGGLIYRNGAPVPRESTYTYLASTWAKPELEMDGVLEDCYRMQSDTPGWDSETFWPETALALLG